MLRHLSAVMLSAFIGSASGTLIWVAWEGGTGMANPAAFVTGFALATMFFTIPGSMLLMLLTIILADRGMKASESSVPVVVAGTVAGASVLAFFSLQFMALGALYGFLTGVAFVSTLALSNGFPSRLD